MINTLNETALHRSLKALYLVQEDGSRAESPVGQYIADILRPDGSVVEIQTQSLSHLKPKLEAYLREGRRVTVVYPVVTVKYIETHLRDGTVTRRRSPKRQHLYAMFRELTALSPLLSDPLLTVDAVEVTVTEERARTAGPVQSANGRRRFRKDWLKTGKRLEEAGAVHRFSGRDGWLSLLPRTCGPLTVRTCHEALLAEGIRCTADDVSLMLWVLLHAGFLLRHKEGRAYVYEIADPPAP